MELGRLISEVPDLLSSGWDLKPVPATAIMSTRQGIMQCDSLEAANLKLMQGHLQVFDVAVKTLHAHQKQTLEDIADLQLENNALGRELDSQKISIKQYTEYQTLLTLGIIDMADHLKWTMAGLRGQDKIWRPILSIEELWAAGKKQILEKIVEFEGEIQKVSEKRKQIMATQQN